MTWITSEWCRECGGQFEVTVWELGHKDSDSLYCPCCGAVIRCWSNEARSYSISSIVNPGYVNVTHNDWERLRFEMGSEVVEGILLGVDATAVTAIASSKIANPWIIQTGPDSAKNIIPEAGWRVRLAPAV